MGVYAFCPNCEEKTMVWIDHYYLRENEETAFSFVLCGCCGAALNMDRWVGLTVVDHEEEPGEDQVSPWLNLVFKKLPFRWLVFYNRLASRIGASCILPDPTTIMDVPEIMESFIVQVERHSGEKFGGDIEDENDFREFVERSFDIICAKTEAAHG